MIALDAGRIYRECKCGNTTNGFEMGIPRFPAADEQNTESGINSLEIYKV